MGRLVSNKVVLGIGGVAVVAVIAIVVVVFATGIIGGGGPGGGNNPQDLILEDANNVTVQNVAAILGTEFPDGIPQQMLEFQVFNMPDGPDIDLEDAVEWKEEWGDVFANNSQIPGWMKEAITLEEVTYVMEQLSVGSSGLVISGNFDFEGIRGTLEDEEDGPGLNDGEYRGFEVWGDDEIALLEDRGLIVLSTSGNFVQDLLKALDMGGFVDDDSGLKRALDKAGDVLVMRGGANCASGSFFPVSGISRCEGLVDTVEGGDVLKSTVSGVYVFRNETSAENGREDIEAAVEDQSSHDADVERVENSGEFVTYRAIIHQEYGYDPPNGPGPVPGGGTKPQDLILEDTDYVVVQNVAAILGTEFPDGIPQQMLRFQVFNMPGGPDIDLEDAVEWKEEWGDVFANNMPAWMKEAITLEEVTYVMRTSGQSSGSGLVISGNFNFEDIRGTLEDDKDGPGLKDGEYRDFEVWGNNEIALLEGRGLIVYSLGFVQEFLKALDRGGFVDDDSSLKQALDEVGNVLVMSGDADCATGSFFPVSGISRCEANVDAVKGGDVFESTVSGVYVFRNENSAESGRDDIEDAIEDLSNYDADAERVENSGEFVTYLAIIHQDYEYNPPRPTPQATFVPPVATATMVPGGGFCTADIITSIGTVYGEWDGSCFSSYTGYITRSYLFTLDSTADVIIDLESSLDAYLVLLEGEGNRGSLLLDDDDGGNNYNSRIEARLSPGIYTIEASNIDDGTGSFALTLTVR